MDHHSHKSEAIGHEQRHAWHWLLVVAVVAAAVAHHHRGVTAAKEVPNG